MLPSEADPALTPTQRADQARSAVELEVSEQMGTQKFKQAVLDLEEMLIGPSGSTFVRPETKPGRTAWFGQLAADQLHVDTSTVRAEMASIKTHLHHAETVRHPMSDIGTRLPGDVKAAAAWVVDHRADVAAARNKRASRIESIAATLSAGTRAVMLKAPRHVQRMRAYAPHVMLVAAITAAINWPDTGLATDLAAGFQPHGCMPNTGAFRNDHAAQAMGCSSWDELCQDDPDWSSRLFTSIAAEAAKPQNEGKVRASWQRTHEEVRVGWASPVVGGMQELSDRFGDGKCRPMRRFAVPQGNGVRNCDNGAKSGHNDCTAMQERIVMEGADFPVEASAFFASLKPIDGSWWMQLGVTDAIAAYRRIACSDPSATVVAQWDPRPAEEGGQRVALFYVQGFNFGLSSAVLAYYRYSEFLTRAAVRLLPLVACHYVDDWGVCEPNFAGGSGQVALHRLARVLGINFDALEPAVGPTLPAKVKWPLTVQTFLGVEFDFRKFKHTGTIRTSVPQARRDKITAMLQEAIANSELPDGVAKRLCGKLQFTLGWCAGKFGRAALSPIYAHAHRRNAKWSLALEGSLRFFNRLLDGSMAREVCVKAGGRAPPYIIWTDAMYATGERFGQVAYVVRVPGGARMPGEVMPKPHPRFVHGFAAVPEATLEALEARKQQIGQLELLAAVAVYYSMPSALEGADVVHYIDNSAAVFGVAKGYSNKPDSARIIHALHALNVNLGAFVHFEWVATDANIADLPSRGEFSLLEELGSAELPFTFPPFDGWLSPEEARAAAADVPPAAQQPQQPESSGVPPAQQEPPQQQPGEARKPRGGRRNGASK